MTGLPNKVTGDWIEAVYDVPDVLLEQANANPPTSFVSFYDKFRRLLGELGFECVLIDNWPGEIPETAEGFYNLLLINPDTGGKRNWKAIFKATLWQFNYNQLKAIGEAFGWEPTVQYTVRALDADARRFVTGNSMNGTANVNLIVAAHEFLCAVLTGLRGYVDPETGEELKLVFNKTRVGHRTMRIVSGKTIDKLPEMLRGEISNAARDAAGIIEEEVEEINFTPSSPSVSRTAPATVPETAATKPSVHMAVEKEE